MKLFQFILFILNVLVYLYNESLINLMAGLFMALTLIVGELVDKSPKKPKEKDMPDE